MNALVYPSTRDTSHFEQTSRSTIYQRIREGYKDETIRILDKHKEDILDDWQHTSKGEYQKDKSEQLQCAVFSGVERSKNASVTEFPVFDIITCDIDNNTPEELDIFFSSVSSSKYPFIEACARSVSGYLIGSLWATVRVEKLASAKKLPRDIAKILWKYEKDPLAKANKLYAAWSHYLCFIFGNKGIVLQGGDNIKRPRYLTHDPEIFVNEDCKEIPLSELYDFVRSDAYKSQDKTGQKGKSDQNSPKGQNHKPLSGSNALDLAHKYASKRSKLVEGAKHIYLSHFAIACNLYGVPKEQCEKYVREELEINVTTNCIDYPYKKYRENFGNWSYCIRNERQVIQLKGKRISDYAEELARHLKTHKKVSLSAGTGTGKSYAISNCIAPKMALESGGKSLIVLPYNSKVRQDAKQYNHAYYTGEKIAREKSTRKTALDEVLTSDVILTNVDNAPLLIKEVKKMGLPVHLFIDESHLLVTGLSFRKTAILKLYHAMQKADTTLLYSGTSLPYFEQIGYFGLEFTSPKRGMINLEFLEGQKRVELCALKHVKNTTADIHIIKIQSKQKIEITKRLLLKHGYSEDEVLSIYSKSKDSEILFSGDEKETFPSHVKIVLCTKYISSGFDILSSRKIAFASIERGTNIDVTEFVQFIDRHRTKEDKDAYLYYRKTDANGIYSNTEKIFHDQLERTKRYAKFYTEEYRKDKKVNFYQLDKLKLSHRSLIKNNLFYFNDEEDSYEVNTLELMYMVEDAKVKNTYLEQAIDEIRDKYPYIQIKDSSTSGKVELTEAQKEEERKLREQVKEENKMIREKIKTLYKKDSESFVQNVARHSASKKPLQLVDIQDGCKDLENDDLYSKPLAEKIALQHLECNQREIEVTEDLKETIVSPSKWTSFIGKYKLLLLIFIYEYAEGKYRNFLTIPLKAEAKKLIKLRNLFTQGEWYSNRFIYTQINKHYEGLPPSKSAASNLLKILFEVQGEKYKDVRGYRIGDYCTWDKFVCCQHKDLIINKIEGQNDISSIYIKTRKSRKVSVINWLSVT